MTIKFVMFRRLLLYALSPAAPHFEAGSVGWATGPQKCVPGDAVTSLPQKCVRVGALPTA